MTNIKWIFLAYVARSGSTYFANQLASATTQVLVLPETKIVDILVGLDAESLASMTAQEKLLAVQKDPRWENLDIPDEEFYQLCTKNQSAFILLNNIVVYLASKNNLTPTHVMVKNGASIWNYKKIKNVFVDAEFVHVRRDPRGSTASRLNKIPLYKDKAGARLSDPWFLAKHWMRYMQRIELIRNSGIQVYEISYEEMMVNPIATLDDYLGILGIARQVSTTNAFKLSKKESLGKHANVNLPPISERLQAWKSELPYEKGLLVELLCSKYVTDPFFSDSSNTRVKYKVLIFGFVEHLRISVARAFERAKL